MARSVILAAVAWLILAALYALFAGSIDTSEIIAGLPATLLAAAFVIKLRQSQARHMRLAAPWGRVIGAPMAALLPDAVQVGRVLLRALVRRPAGPVGAMSRQSFRHGADAPPQTARCDGAPNGVGRHHDAPADAGRHHDAPADAGRHHDAPADAGRHHDAPADAGRHHDAPADAGRRGLVTLGLSLAPNGYVVDLPDGEDVVVLHRLVPAAPNADADWPL